MRKYFIIKNYFNFLIRLIILNLPRKKIFSSKKKITGLNIIGHYKNYGLGIYNEAIKNVLSKKYNICSIYLEKNIIIKKNVNYNVNILIGSPDVFFSSFLFLSFFLNLYKNKNILIIFWELEKIPNHWFKLMHWIDEIWVPTQFIKNSVKKLNKPIYKIPIIFDNKLNKIYNRSNLKLPTKKFIFLFTFDFRSILERKNPKGVIEAFKLAFQNSDDVLLIIKSQGGNLNLYKNQLEELKLISKSYLNIIFIDEFLSRDKHLSLIKCCNCYISLHRSEGLGLAMLEAMSFGKPVIATNYSGNLEFMNDNNGCLVNYKKIKPFSYAGHNIKGQFWAEPDINYAAKQIVKIKNNKYYRKKLSLNSLKTIKNYNLNNAGEKILNLLQN